jgi:hypothetical protein
VNYQRTAVGEYSNSANFVIQKRAACSSFGDARPNGPLFNFNREAAALLRGRIAFLTEIAGNIEQERPETS